MEATPRSVRREAGLAYVCGRYGEISAVLGGNDTGPFEPLDRLLDVLREWRGTDPDSSFEQEADRLLELVHAALVNMGDEYGVYGNAGFRSAIDAAGVEGLEIVYRCPLRLCAGRDEVDVVEFPPRCSVNGAPLPRERLG
ncbi:hypothetical protein [Spirillospora sp. NPDC029432]|uniref:hypothetical protein n=1 Tax=Spirillospora sp. NPDC029432 TaxID=3154599 RepID=UPI0034523314